MSLKEEDGGQESLLERIIHKRSPSHTKTLDILAKSTKFSSLSTSNLVKYCSFARIEGKATSLREAADFLGDRYGWDVIEDLPEFQTAWLQSLPEGQDPPSSIDKKEDNAPLVYPDRIEDHHRVKFKGDVGAVGRLTLKEGSKIVTIDLKGQQFEGEIFPGPTVLVVNTTQNPFANKSSTPGLVQERMKIDAITNEFCKFKFKKDMMSDLIGSYTGDIASMKPTETRGAASSTGSKGKKRSIDDETVDSGGDVSDEGGGSSSKKSKKKVGKESTGRSNPKITTINRKQSKEKKKRKSISKK